MEDLSWRKVFSGRFLMAVSAAFTMAYCAANKIIPAEAVVLLLSQVARHYFMKKKEE